MEPSARADRRDATGEDAAGPELTVVLPVLNEARDLGGLLDQLRAGDAGDGALEVIVVDGGSTDGTREMVRERAAAWPALRLLDNPGRRSATGRNVGARAAAGRFVLFLDGHCALERSDYLARTTALFRESGADCLCRPQPLDRLAGRGWSAAIAAARHSPLGHNPGSDVYASTAGFTRPESAGAAYRREVLLALGGFDERFDACEDVEFNHRAAQAGYGAYRHPDLAVAYRPRGNLSGLARQMFRYGRGRARLMSRHPELVPWALVLPGVAALAGAVAAVVWPRIGLPVLGGGAAAWAVLCLVEGVRTGNAIGEPLRTALVFPVIHAALLAGFVRGLADAPAFRSPSPAGGGEP